MVPLSCRSNLAGSAVSLEDVQYKVLRKRGRRGQGEEGVSVYKDMNIMKFMMYHSPVDHAFLRG
jgi:hypothetical protein